MIYAKISFEIWNCYILIIFVCIYSCLLLLDDRIRLNKVMLVKIFALCALNRLRSKINCIHRPAQGRRSVLFACLPQTNSRFNAWSMLIGLKLAAPFRTCKRTKILKRFRIDVGFSFIDLQLGGYILLVPSTHFCFVSPFRSFSCL